MKSMEALNPVAAFCYFLAVIGVAVFTRQPVLVAISLVSGIGFSALCVERWLRSLLLFLPVALIVAATNPLFVRRGDTPLFFLNDNPVTKEALLYGAVLGAAFLSLFLWLRCYAAVMDAEKQLYLFGKISPKIALLITAAMRMIPLFVARSRQVRDARQAGGFKSGKLKSALQIWRVTLSRSLEGAIQTGDSMRARGYQNGKRTHFSLFRFRTADAMILLITAVIFVLILISPTGFEYYPSLSRINTSTSAAEGYIAYAWLCLLPLILEGKERVTWKYSVSKI